MELYNVKTLPLSNNQKLRLIQEKILRGESLSTMEKVMAGRDHPVKELAGYKLMPDHCYRAVSEEIYKRYLESGFILGNDATDEYQEYEENGEKYYNNRGVDWFLGGVALKYGDIILECPADKKYFTPSFDNGTRLSVDPTVRHFKSSGVKNPIPMTMITNVFDVKELKAQKDKENLKQLLKVRELNKKRMEQLREQQLSNLQLLENKKQIEDSISGGKSR